MIGDFFFVVRVFLYSVLVAIVLQVQWRGESLEQKTMRWVAESSTIEILRDTAQKLASRLNYKVDETSSNMGWKVENPPTEAKSRTLINLRRSDAAIEQDRARSEGKSIN